MNDLPTRDELAESMRKELMALRQLLADCRVVMSVSHGAMRGVLDVIEVPTLRDKADKIFEMIVRIDQAMIERSIKKGGSP